MIKIYAFDVKELVISVLPERDNMTLEDGDRGIGYYLSRVVSRNSYFRIKD